MSKHGRLIDADALKEILQAWKYVAQELGAEINNMFASAIIAQVDAMPTIEPERGSCETCKRASSYCCKSEEDITRCPIEEHYRLPRDGYCHLYEER